MSLSEGWVLPYTPIENGTQLLLRVDFQAGKFSKKLVALIDTGASLCVIKKGIIPDKNAIKVREDSVLTTNGIIQSTIYKGVIKIQERVFSNGIHLSRSWRYCSISNSVRAEYFGSIKCLFIREKASIFTA